MNERDLEITIAVLEVLSAMGTTLLAAAHLEKSVRLKTTPKATPSETLDRVQWCESKGLITSVRTDVGLLFGLKPEGKAWLQIHG